MIVAGLLCSLQDLRSPPLVPLQSLGVRSLVLLSHLGADRLHTLWILILPLPYEVISRNKLALISVSFELYCFQDTH